MSTPTTTINNESPANATTNSNNNQSDKYTRRWRLGQRGTRNTHRKNGSIPESFKGAIPEVGDVIGTKHENNKESFEKNYKMQYSNM